MCLILTCDLSVKMAAKCHSCVENDLIPIAQQTWECVDRLYPQGKLTEVCIVSICPTVSPFLIYPSPQNFLYINHQKTKHNAELHWTYPGTKVTGDFSTKGRIFPPNA